MIQAIEVKDFDLRQTLECGQCFNFEKLDENEYLVIAKGKLLHVMQEDDGLYFFDVDVKDLRHIWVPYFDLDRDYTAIKNDIVDADPKLKPIVQKYYGIHILNQDFEETLISFIISQNKNIPQIKRSVRDLCQRFGEPIGEYDGVEYRSFPDLEALKKITEEEFREIKTGFRAPYLIDAVRRLAVDGPDRLIGDELKNLSSGEARERLMQIKGVGEKVANCVLLFGLGFREAFPVDVWIARVMEELYHDEMAAFVSENNKDSKGKKSGTDVKISRPDIEEFGMKKFGKWGGYAQQYLFMYAREKQND